MDSSHYLTLLLIGQPLLRRTLSLQMHEPLRQRIAVQYHLEGLSRDSMPISATSLKSPVSLSPYSMTPPARPFIKPPKASRARSINSPSPRCASP